jgi:hypothetical protein
MMEPITFELPFYAPLSLFACLLLVLLFFILAIRAHKIATGILVIWILMLTAVVHYIPGVQPMLLFGATLFFLFIATFISLNSSLFKNIGDEHWHYLHLWRLPFAFVLLWFYQAGISPLQLTFEGINYDIIIGLTAPVIASLAFSQKMLNKSILIGWNIIGVVVLILSIALIGLDLSQNPTGTAAFSMLPYAYATGFLLPVSLFAHGICLYRLFSNKVVIES